MNASRFTYPSGFYHAILRSLSHGSLEATIHLRKSHMHPHIRDHARAFTIFQFCRIRISRI